MPENADSTIKRIWVVYCQLKISPISIADQNATDFLSASTLSPEDSSWPDEVDPAGLIGGNVDEVRCQQDLDGASTWTSISA